MSESRSSRPIGTRSIRWRLSAAALLFLVLIVGVGTFGIEQLGDANRVADEIRTRWLQDIALIGDLNNFMSDYRAAEGTDILARGPVEQSAAQGDIARLAAAVEFAQHGYESRPHDPGDRRAYDEFAAYWRAYEAFAARTLAAAREGDREGAINLYMSDSRTAFDAASDALGRLTERAGVEANQASSRALAAYQRDRRLIGLAMLFATALALATVLYIVRSVSDPMRRLAVTLHAIAAHDTGVEVPHADRIDEIGEMARSIKVFRDDATALAASRRLLAEQTATLEEALQGERRLTQQQRNFLALASHEFRTPLTVIDAHAQRLIRMKDRLEPADVQERASRIRDAVSRLTHIIDSLLDTSRLLDDPRVYQPVEFDPAPLLADVCRLHQETSRGTDIHPRIGTLPMRMYGDPALLFAVFSNLLSNALKFSAPGSPVDFQVDAVADEALRVVVRDRGIGVPRADRQFLFERYFRGTNATGIAGSGVGLHLVAMAVELHGGSVDVQSEEGVGSAFTVYLPLAAVRPAAVHGVVAGRRAN